jgi:hypothetical protein
LRIFGLRLGDQVGQSGHGGSKSFFWLHGRGAARAAALKLAIPPVGPDYKWLTAVAHLPVGARHNSPISGG